MCMPTIVSTCVSSGAKLFAKPCVRGLTREPRVPYHEIGKGFDLTRRFDDAHACYLGSHFCQSTRDGEDQIGFRDGEDRRDKEWKTERHVTFGPKLRQSAVHRSLLTSLRRTGLLASACP